MKFKLGTTNKKSIFQSKSYLYSVECRKSSKRLHHGLLKHPLPYSPFLLITATAFFQLGGHEAAESIARTKAVP